MKEKRKVIVAIVLFVAVAIIIVACGYISTNKDKETGSTPSEAPSAASTAAPTEAPASDSVSEAPTSDTESTAPPSDTETTAAPAETEAPSDEETEEPTEVPTDVPETAAPETEAPTAEPTAAPTAVPTVAPTSAPTAAPTAVPTAAPTVAPTAVPTAVPATAAPTAAPTAVPTAAPTAAPTSQYPWSAEVTEYLLDTKRGYAALIKSEFGTTESEYAIAKGTIFGKCAKSYGHGIHIGNSGNPVIETVNKDGVIAQTYVTRYFDQGLFEWVDNVKIVTGVYLDVDYVKPGATLITEIPFDSTPWYDIMEKELFGVEITRKRALRDDFACNYYPLTSGEFVLDIGGNAIILNKIPESVSIMYNFGEEIGVFDFLQIGVNGHVVYETDCFAASAHAIPDYSEPS